jgi:hypothetical protein
MTNLDEMTLDLDRRFLEWTKEDGADPKCGLDSVITTVR